ncbi:MAG: VOC family protein [SAR202 cluster bacterium]|nr:VOC family protein [SAR202 cluster bacterium]
MGVTAYHTGFVVTDLDRSIKFYTEGLGLECEQVVDDAQGPGLSQVVGYENVRIRAAFLVADDGQMLELLQYVNPKVTPREHAHQYPRHLAGAAHLGFFVEDVHGTFERLKKLGAKPLNPPATVRPGVTGSYVQDPDGNWFEIVQDDLHNKTPFKVRQNRTRVLPKK